MNESNVKLRNLLRWAHDYIADGEGVHDDGMLIHECEMRTNPEKGGCDICDRWVDIMDALGLLKSDDDSE